jgi:hypothetical protein
VRQRIRPARHKPFARPLAHRLVFEAQGFAHVKWFNRETPQTHENYLMWELISEALLRQRAVLQSRFV